MKSRSRRSKTRSKPIAEEPEAEEPEDEAPAAKPTAKAAPGFSKLFDSLAGLTGFHAQSVKVEPVLPEPAADEEVPRSRRAREPVEEVVAEVEEPEVEEPVAQEPEPEQPQAEKSRSSPSPSPSRSKPKPKTSPPPIAQTTEQAEQPSSEAEGPLQDKLTEVRAMADEARLAKLRANSALYEGLSAAYDFALDAEDAPEEYLRLVEAQGLKIQLRSPMKPVVKLAFDGLCDDATIKQLEAVLAWAFDQELPRGALAEKIEAAGGIARVLQRRGEGGVTTCRNTLFTTRAPRCDAGVRNAMAQATATATAARPAERRAHRAEADRDDARRHAQPGQGAGDRHVDPRLPHRMLVHPHRGQLDLAQHRGPRDPVLPRRLALPGVRRTRVRKAAVRRRVRTAARRSAAIARGRDPRPPQHRQPHALAGAQGRGFGHCDPRRAEPPLRRRCRGRGAQARRNGQARANRRSVSPIARRRRGCWSTRGG